MDRPFGVTVVAILCFVGAGIGMLGALWVFLTAKHSTGRAGSVIAVVAITGLYTLAVAALSVVTGVGLLKLRNWARRLTVAFSWLSVAGLLLGVGGSLLRGQIFRLMVDLIFLALFTWVIWYMFRPYVARAFGTKQEVPRITA